MRLGFALSMTLHAIIHLLGFLQAFGLAKIPRLAEPISAPLGLLWLAAAVLILASGLALWVSLDWWWAIAGVAVVISQVAIAAYWSDAKLGTLGNLVLLVGAGYGLFTDGPASFRAKFEREIAAHARPPIATAGVSEADLAKLPAPVQRYLRASGVVGRAPVRSYRVLFRGRIRSDPESAWMPFEAEQYSFVQPPVRLFLMRATRGGLPVHVLHRLVEGRASMKVRLLGAWPLVDASGPVLDRSEAVTLFNDMCILAPGSLLEPSIAWQAVDERAALATFTNGNNTISALLTFDAEGRLTNFASEDRSRASADGRTFARVGFSTPVRDYRSYRGHQLASYGEAHFHPAEGEFAYGEFHILDVQFNP